MIKLLQQNTYLSLQKIENYELEDFTIITGLNGSGKTHLLKAINEGIIKVENIDQSGIIYYNYNDFNLFNEDLLKNSNLQDKNDIYNTKRSTLLQNLSNQRISILSNYNIYTDINLLEIDKLLLQNSEVLRWSDEEIEIFEKKQNEDNFLFTTDTEYRLNYKQSQLLHLINEDLKTVDIRKWLSDVSILVFKTRILNIIRHDNYNIEILNWDDSEIEKYKIIKEQDPNFYLSLMTGHVEGFSQNFIAFINITHHYFQNLEFELINVKHSLREIYNDLIIYFKENISKDYLQLSIQINGEENILYPINVDSGFLNLQEIANAEKSYQIAKEQNQYLEFQATKQNKDVYFYSDEEFLKIYGDSPIKLLNTVLNEYDCNGYEFIQSQIDFHFGMNISQQNVSISLSNKKENYITDLNDLSSGEKTLIALSFYIYKLKKKSFITNLMLLDEIDSALHPSMSKRLLDVLYNIFHKKMGIKIILSTHSPSTVALAPKESIFIMDKCSTPKIMKVSKDKALKELTFGVPSFSVNYENRRQVFVESEYDASYYESLYYIYNDKLNPEISLNFISSGKTKINGNGIGIASCDQVISIVDILRKAGNNFSWGIIDWDLKHKSSEFIKVLGDSQRYSIENYLLDPLLLAILLWKENILKAEHFGCENNEVYFNILNFSQSQLQQIIDKIISDLQVNVKNEDLSEYFNYELCNGMTLKLPVWYCKIQGHSLEEDIIMKTYPQLEAIRKKDESALKKAIINKVIFNFKDLSPLDLLSIFKSIQAD
ncbi:AAA family ATPase [Chryseobacterium sp. SG20098]|uniref:AAA family ATPase n=1 Tax=Chryseobacterium sp. SG20098 TaxID=3074145 RepID=UPI00288304E4|nr:AAA family ATPase [Chryseobacterium sp. SG20098]WNI38391.1 AAA family ATPase [Chryseobacterium sp. SG20098]